ncbi:conserved exported hypothetical protein [Agrobacterium fabrum str. J-07]|jgi:hypothetical protein|uniref:Uncharacterized protein n=1 Tax=Agrobacterium fabrum TaxID=1176649 RepID=A0A7Z7BG38_9HYPH|nr:hypothetical protein [Agrobacterium fabrum]QKW97437.1 hypothetical protein GSF67_10240 [Agrobacterium sp. CGMCC 11546]NTB08002.1 hypothetical protein [Agrobacterium fabrum]CAH0212041.1 hypothetical protein SRABI46_02269 [Agrobacterium fabrum]CAH0260322.1 hypothetical protein SRABI05_03225 [Agrobacterium fabrum]CUX10601.1 conserved exported hypothetical protein [Agrobacterium fabrum str. J-07]
MRYTALFSAAALFSVIFASVAEARKDRLFAISESGGGETIALVYDLPNTPAFLAEGNTLDLGFLNSDSGSGYVLYYGDRYTRLSDADVARLKSRLGFDPTIQHRLERAAREKQNERWNLAIFFIVLVVGFFLVVLKGLDAVRWFWRLLTMLVDTDKGQAAEPHDPLKARKKRLVRPQYSQPRTDSVAASPAPPPVEASPPTGGTARAFGRRTK